MLEERENERMMFREEGKGRNESFYMRESFKMEGGDRKEGVYRREREGEKMVFRGG